MPGDCSWLSGLWQALTAISSFQLHTNFLGGSQKKILFRSFPPLFPRVPPVPFPASLSWELWPRMGAHRGVWWRNPQRGVGHLDAPRGETSPGKEHPSFCDPGHVWAQVCLSADPPAVTETRRDHCRYFMKSVRGSFSVAQPESRAFTALSLIFSFFPPSSFYIIQSKSDSL